MIAKRVGKSAHSVLTVLNTSTRVYVFPTARYTYKSSIKYMTHELYIDMSEGYNLREIRAYIDEQISFSEDRMRRHFDKAIDELRGEMKNVATRIADKAVKQAASNDHSTALTIPEATRKELTMSVRKEVTREVYDFLDKSVMPRIDNAIQYMHMKSEDGDELVTRYRRELHSTVSKGDRKMITGAADGDRLREFQKNTLFFNDND